LAEITDIKPQIKDKKRCSVFIDGKFFCGLLSETAIIHKLKVGQFIETELLEKIQFDNEKNQALDKSLNFLSRSMKTKKQVEDYLKKKGYTQPVCDYVLEKLKDYKFVDDFEYSKSYINYKSKYKGKKLLELELKQKGADKEDIEKALNDMGDETESAKNVLNKYIKNKEFNKENLYKAFKYLLSKGFEYETAKTAISSLNGEEIEDY
jgi:regulatory protein